MKDLPADNIVFFDGHCNLCNGLVNFLMGLRTADKFKYASLQGETALQIPTSLKEIDSIVFYSQGEFYVESDAAIQICSRLNWPYKVFHYTKYFPKKWRDGFYRMVARSRYKVFGRKDICRIPTEAEKSVFLP